VKKKQELEPMLAIYFSVIHDNSSVNYGDIFTELFLPYLGQEAAQPFVCDNSDISIIAAICL
jgi:hypothetical protein